MTIDICETPCSGRNRFIQSVQNVKAGKSDNIFYKKNFKNVVTFNYFYVIIKKNIFYFHIFAKYVNNLRHLIMIQVVECWNK